MLTIQPRITHYSNTRNIAFRGNEKPEAEELTAEERLYRMKRNRYEKQVAQLDNLIQDKQTNNYLKKILKACKVVSEGLLEGWAVAWGAHKGAKIVKPSIIAKGAESKTYKFLRPVLNGGKKLGEALSKGIDNIKASKLYTGAAEKLAVITEKMNNHSVGKYVVKAFEYIGKAFKFVGGLFKKGYEAIAKPFKGKTGEELYDKAAKVTSNTMGVGAGTAGAYDAATKDSRKATKPEATEQGEQVESETETQTDSIDEINEVEQMLEDGE